MIPGSHFCVYSGVPCRVPGKREGGFGDSPPTHPLQTTPPELNSGVWESCQSLGSVSSWRKTARKSQIVMVKACPGRVKVFSPPPLCSFKGSCRRGAGIGLWSALLSVLWMGNSPGKGLSLPAASLGVILESSERPGLLLFVKQQLTVHILWEKVEILLFEYI